MTFNETFILLFGISCFTYLLWGFKTFPRDRQFLAAFPEKKIESEEWTGVNLTYYGFLVATGLIVAVFVNFMLLGGLGIPLFASLVLSGSVLCLSVPAAKGMAVLIEGKENTFTTCGAFFVGLIFTPSLVLFLREVFFPEGKVGWEIVPILAAFTISYCIGEGLGRLGCISFGCCYGKPLETSSPKLKKMFKNFYFIFSGESKKISYAHGWEGKPVIPVQALSSLICILGGLIGLFLFVKSYFQAALFISIMSSQGWRIVAEFLRSDFRGEGNSKAYLWLSFVAIIYSLIIMSVASGFKSPSIDLFAGLKTLWRPDVILFLQLLWIGILVYMGKSRVTGSIISFYVHSDKI